MSPGQLLPLPEKLSSRGGADYSRLAVKLIEDLSRNGSGNAHILNVPDFLGIFGPSEMFMEIPVSLDSKGADSVGGIFKYKYPPLKRMAPEITEIIARVRDYEILTVEAGLTGDLKLAEKALIAHPLIARPLVGGSAVVSKILSRISSE